MNIINIIPISPSYHQKDIIEFSIYCDSLNEYNYIQFFLYCVEQESEYDTFIEKYTTPLINVSENYTIRIEAKYFDPKFYFIGEVEIFKKNNIEDTFPVKFKKFKNEEIKTLGFEVLADDKIKYYDFQTLNDKIFNIRNERDNKFLLGFGNRELSQYYSVLVMCQNIYLTKHYYYDNYEVIPFSSYLKNDLFEMINRYLENINVSKIFEPEKRADLNYDNPCLVISFPKLYADSIETASNLAEEEANNLLKTFALTRDSLGIIASTIVIDGFNKKLHLKTYKQHYKGNIIHGDEFGENPFLNRKVVKIIKENHYFNFLVSLYSDAIKEDKVEASFSKTWSLIEIIAEKRNFPDTVLKRKYLDGTKIENKDGRKINPSDKVRELIRQYIPKSKEIEYIFNSQYDTINRSDDLITIWYRHRNCMMHSGGCFPNDATICKENSFNHKICKKAHLDVLKNNSVRTIYNDNYFHALSLTTRFILLYMILDFSDNLENIENDLLSMSIKTIPSNSFTTFDLEQLGDLESLFFQ